MLVVDVAQEVISGSLSSKLFNHLFTNQASLFEGMTSTSQFFCHCRTKFDYLLATRVLSNLSPFSDAILLHPRFTLAVQAIVSETPRGPSSLLAI